MGLDIGHGTTCYRELTTLAKLLESDRQISALCRPRLSCGAYGRAYAVLAMIRWSCLASVGGMILPSAYFRATPAIASCWR